MKSTQQNINALGVWLHNTRIGIINRLAGDRYIFSFEQNYIDNEKRPTLSLSFKDQLGGLITSTRMYSVRLPPFFSNLLPEGHLREYLALKANVNPEREFFLLAALGADLPGAITIMPLEEGSAAEPPIIQDNLHQETVMRFSLAGLQLKFSAVMESSGELTIPANGVGGSWIVKLPSARFDAVPENEFVMLALARAIGIDLPQNKLIDIADIHGLPEEVVNFSGKALAVKRFDRHKNGEHIHMEDFAQVFGLFPAEKYQQRSYANIAAVLRAETSAQDTDEFIRRLVFSVLIGNADMHLKNWSLIYPDLHKPVFAPAYDLVSTIPYIPNDQLALSFGGSRSLSEINSDQIRRFAETAHLPVRPVTQLVHETVDKTVAAWRSLAEKALLPDKIRNIIDLQLQTVAKNIKRRIVQ